MFAGLRVSGGHLCEAEATTEAVAETEERSGDGAEENNIRFKRINLNNVASFVTQINVDL